MNPTPAIVISQADHPDLIRELNNLKDIVRFGVISRRPQRRFYDISNIIQNGLIQNGRELTYINNNNETLYVSSVIQQIKGLPYLPRWLNHLYFIDGWGRERKFKSHVANKYNLHFS